MDAISTSGGRNKTAMKPAIHTGRQVDLYLIPIDAWCRNMDTFETMPIQTGSIRDVIERVN